MQSEYVSELERRYLILTGEEPVDREAFQVQMLLGSYVPSLLDCSLQGLNGKDRFYYEITGMKSLKEWAGESSLSFEKLRFILLQVISLFEEMREYLMSPAFLVLGAEYIYIDEMNQKAFFCFLPGCGHEPQGQFISLAEELIRFLDPEDTEGTELGYKIYGKVMEEGFRPEKLREAISRIRQNAEQLAEPIPAKTENEYRSHRAEIKIEEGTEKRREKEIEEKKMTKKHARRLFFCILLTMILLILLAGSAAELLPRVPAVASMVFLGLLLVLMLILEQSEYPLAKTRKKRGEREERYWMVPGNGNLESAFCLEQELVIMGSRPKVCDVVLPEKYADPVHARIRWKKKGCYLADLSGRGQTRVGEHVLVTDEEYLLRDGDAVRIGELVYRFTVR